MAEMEKEGRPPENKRSRKPAHPVKREINEEMKNFAENTMNELLGWYGYDKVELKDGEDIEFRNYSADGESRQHISVLKENSLPKPKLPEDSVISPYNINTSYPGLATGNGLSDSPAGSKDHGSVPIILPLIPPPFIKPPAEDDVSNVQIMCAWCQKVGIKRYSLSMGSEVKCFCSEKCFAACRRAYFKRNKARDEDGHAENFPQQHYAKETPRLAFKNNCELLHSRHKGGKLKPTYAVSKPSENFFCKKLFINSLPQVVTVEGQRRMTSITSTLPNLSHSITCMIILGSSSPGDRLSQSFQH